MQVLNCLHAQTSAGCLQPTRLEQATQLPSFYAEDSVAAANETWARLHADPLFAMKQQEIAARKRVIKNPVLMAAVRQEARLASSDPARSIAIMWWHVTTREEPQALCQSEFLCICVAIRRSSTLSSPAPHRGAWVPIGDPLAHALQTVKSKVMLASPTG